MKIKAQRKGVRANDIKILCAVPLFLLPMGGLSATAANAQSIQFTFSMPNTTVREVLERIEKESDYKFVYYENTIDPSHSVSINAKGNNIEYLLDEVLRGEGVSYEIKGNQILLKKNELGVISQQKTNIIKGVVRSENGESIIGATIRVLGTSMGTITDYNGNFSIEASGDATLEISYIGYKTQQIKVNNKQQLNIVIKEDTEMLDEVVVVGYGVQKKATLTGSVASVQSKDISKVKTPNITNALAGKLPGLRAVQRSGAPGDDAANIDIRGFGNALVIVDGVERSFSQIDANDVESISVLKDASASVYGFKGANGVILVTTKKGATESKPTISYNGYYGFQNETRFPELFNSYDYATLYNEAQMNIGVKAPFSKEELEKYKAGNDPAYPNTDWWNLITKKAAPQMYHNLSVTGGSNKVKYYFSLGYTNQTGLWKTNDNTYKKYNVRSNIEAEIIKGLKVGLQLSGSLDTRNMPYDQEIFKAVYKAHPNLPVYANNKSPYYQDTGDNANPKQITDANEVGYDKRDRREFNGALTINWEIPWVKGLSAKALLSYDYNNNSFKKWFKEYYEYQYDASSDKYNKMTRNALSKLNAESKNSFYPTQQYSLNYQNMFGKHDINALLLWEMKNSHADWVGANRQFYIGALDQMDAGDEINKGNGGSTVETAHAGLVGRINYAFNNKYLAEVSFRYDGSYKFSKDNRWGFFPAMSLGWRVSEESFFKKNISFVDNFKIRGSIGKIGDEGDFAPFQYLTGYFYPSGKYVLGNNGVSNGAKSAGLPNTNLTWYESVTANVGFDASFLHGLLSVEFDYFTRHRKGLLANRLLTLPTSFGQNLPQENLNSDLTRGFELVLTHRNKIGDVNYSISANFTTTRQLNQYIERAASGNMYDNWRDNPNDRYKNITWGYEAIGQFQNFEDILNSPIQDGNGNKSLLPGDIKFRDYNNDGIINDKDFKPIGHNDVPSMYYGFNLSVDWKGFDFNAFFQGAAGHEVNMVETFTEPFIQRGMGNGVVFWKDRWHRENPEDPASAWIPGKMPALRPAGFSLNNERSTWTLLNASYLRLKTIEVGYTLPKKLVGKAGIQNVRLYINSYNPLTITHGGMMKYMDPENSNIYLQYYPQMKSCNFGVNITF